MTSYMECEYLHRGADGGFYLRKMIIFDWYDGPTSGVILCDNCKTAYLFRMIDWDSDHEVRVFGLAAIPGHSLDAVMAFVDEDPMWPVWFPQKLKFPSEEVRAKMGVIDRLIDAVFTPTIVIAWSRTARLVMAAKLLPAELLQKVQDWFECDDHRDLYDWFGFLGIARA